MGSRQIVLVSTAGFSGLREFSGGKLKQKGFFHSAKTHFFFDGSIRQLLTFFDFAYSFCKFRNIFFAIEKKFA
jgi:hypothetical protein